MLCELPDIGFLKIRGNDTKKFLQGQLTCDIESVTAENSCMGAHCNPQGRVISLFYLFRFQEDFYLLMQQNMIPIAMAALKKYAVFFKVELTDASKEMTAIGCQHTDFIQIDRQNLAHIPVSAEHTRCMIAGKPAAIKVAMEQISQLTPAVTKDHWKYLNIRDGIPALYPETSGKFLPHEINLDKLNAISFDKGCYTGQEIIARMHYRGKLKTRLYIAEVSSESSPQPGADIYSMHGSELRTSGMIVDACQGVYNNKYQVLIVANELNNNGYDLYLTHDLSTVLTIP